MTKRMIAAVLMMCLLLSCAPAAYAAPESGGRYTVLVLDVSGPQTFTEPRSFMNMFGAEYTGDSSIEEVKSAARKLLEDVELALSKNYVAIVAFSEEAWVVSGFTDDLDALFAALDSLDYDEDKGRSIAAGLDCAAELLNGVQGENIRKNLLLCTTGITSDGVFSYEGLYDENSSGAKWQNSETEIQLRAYANAAIASADRIKESGVTIYVLGIFSPVEEKIPAGSNIRQIASFFRLTAHDLASSEDTFFAVEDPEDLVFYFGEMQDDLTGSKTVRLFNSAGSYSTDDNSDTVNNRRYHYEEMLWGPDLFEVPSTQLLRSDITDNTSANWNLAMLCGSLCAAAYDPVTLIADHRLLGFEDNNIFLYSYSASSYNRSRALRNGKEFAKDDALSFSIATRPMMIDGVETDLLFITLCGTHGSGEAYNDATMILDKDFYGYRAWDWVYEFEEDVFAGIDDFRSEHTELGSRPMKVLVTGHSLGGAAADLVAARFNMHCDGNEWYSGALSTDDIYAYTFGAIDAIGGNDVIIDGGLSLSEGYENIINIYNLLDNFGPYGSVYGFKLLKDQIIFGKFGEFCFFADTMSSYVTKSHWPQHEISGYIQAVRNGLPGNAHDIGKVKVMICCPVDVEILQDGKARCSIRDNEVTAVDPEADACVSDDIKTILLPAGAEYQVRLTATDSGSMNCIVQNISADAPSTVVYSDIALEAGKTMEEIIPAAISEETVEMFVLDEAGTRTAQIGLDGTETVIRSGNEPEEAETSPEAGEAGLPKDRKTVFIAYFRAYIIVIIALFALALFICITVFVRKAKKKKALRAKQKKMLSDSRAVPKRAAEEKSCKSDDEELEEFPDE